MYGHVHSSIHVEYSMGISAPGYLIVSMPTVNLQIEHKRDNRCFKLCMFTHLFHTWLPTRKTKSLSQLLGILFL